MIGNTSPPLKPKITLITDFGDSSLYVAQLKGVLWKHAPDARVEDLTHAIPPQDIHAGGLFLAQTLPWFPQGTIHIVVVDPGVGTERVMLAGRLRDQYVLLPDNGLVTEAADRWGFESVVRLTREEHWLKPTSATFHGRDILAPVAASMIHGLPLEQLGEPTTDWIRLDRRRPRRIGAAWETEITSIDAFGNLITGLHADDCKTDDLQTVHVRDQSIDNWVRTYGDSDPGALVALFGSSGNLEIAVVQGNAAQRLNASKGDAVVIERRTRGVYP